MDNLEKIQMLRERTGMGVMDLKKALEEASGDENKALELLQKKGVAVAEKRSARVTEQGMVVAYSHGNRIGAVLELNCETDFVAKTEDFKSLAKDLVMQVASMNPKNLDELLEQPFIKESSKTIKDVITEVVGKTGESIKVGKFSRVELGRE